MITVGMSNEKSVWVELKNTAVSMGSGTLPVFATPAMILLAEQAASECLIPELQDGESSVGILVNMKHTSPSLVRAKVTCRVEVKEVDRARVVFDVVVSDDHGVIGTGAHERFIIKADRFMSKAEERTASSG